MHQHAWRAAAALVLLAACGSSSRTNATVDVGDAGEILGPRPPTCDGSSLLPSDLECTGLYANFEQRTVAPEVREFVPALSLWSDGAAKRRWLYLPPGSRIDTSDMDEWVFPIGTKVWKEFTVEGKVLETRLFAKRGPSEWVYTTYVWDKNGARASRVDTGHPNALGTYEIPSKVHCSQCHNGHADRLLGVEAVSLGLPGATGVTLASLASEGRLTAIPPITTLALPGDERAQRALGYLHVNCGITCHSQHSSGTASFTGLLLRLSAKALTAPPADGGASDPTTTDTYRTTVSQDYVSAPYVDDEKFVQHKRVAPRDAERSLLLSVISTRGPGQMPPIVSHQVDEAGVALLRDWIHALP